ncbi:MAG: hypothetical protein SP1CHLAM54_14870 [Chlamydiia bacterium]|nr:hypothetical protein [Chlamydiia bacterium]MCH9616377.1 hypothetical protein [Chlamydiia bacterium]MCH9629637.1 hypothetical protein [Chlamydiia bacterium]
MTFNLLKKLPVAVAALSVVTGFAAMDTESRINSLESQMKQVRGETAMGTYGAVSATARPEVDGQGVYVLADVFVWRARMGGTDYLVTSQAKITNQSLPQYGTVKDINFGWDWGFRVGLGYNFLHDGWDMNLVYTYFRTSKSDGHSVGLNDDIVPTRGSSAMLNGEVGSFTHCNKASSSGRILLNDLMLTLGKAYFISPELSFRPSVGLESTWLDLQQDTTYSNGSQLSVHSVFANDDLNFWGIGPRFAADGKWHLGKGFSFFGDLAFSLLYGQFDVEHKNWFSSKVPALVGSASQTANHEAKISNDKHAFTPMTRMQLGLSYDVFVDNNKQHLGIKLGYETQYWWNVQQFLTVNDQFIDATIANQGVRYEHMNEDLAFNGVTLEVRWDF